jgi:hypothetical protein
MLRGCNQSRQVGIGRGAHAGLVNAVAADAGLPLLQLVHYAFSQRMGFAIEVNFLT